MTREEAIDNLSVAFGECRDAIKRQAEAVGQMADDMDKLNETFRKVKALAKKYASPRPQILRIALREV